MNKVKLLNAKQFLYPHEYLQLSIPDNQIEYSGVWLTKFVKPDKLHITIWRL